MRPAATAQSDWLEVLDHCPNYNAWVFSAIRAGLSEPVLEIGCGIGTFTRLIAAAGHGVEGLDNDAAALAVARRHLADLPQVRLALLDVTQRPLLADHYGSVVLLDVLEHIADDADLLRRIVAALRPGGRLLLKVPAGPWLTGPLDRAVGHHRRYRRAGLRDALLRAGFTVERLGYFNRVGTLGWWWHAKVTRRVTPPRGQVRLFEALVRLLRPLEAALPLPFGQSLIAVARRPV